MAAHYPDFVAMLFFVFAFNLSYVGDEKQGYCTTLWLCKVNRLLISKYLPYSFIYLSLYITAGPPSTT